MQIAMKPVKSGRILLADVSDAFRAMEDSNGVTPDENRAWVIVRQASTEDSIARAGLISRRETKYEADRITGKFQPWYSEVRDENTERRKMMEVYWTVDEIGNLSYDTGEPIFTMPLKGKPLAAFEEAYGRLPIEITDALWRAVISHVTQWNPFLQRS